MDTLEKVQRLEKILWHIKASERYENDFNKLFEMLEDEYRLEGGWVVSAPEFQTYLFHLKITIDKQGEAYKLAKRRRPIKGAPVEYSDFVRHFKQDIEDELMKIKIRSSSSLS